MNEINEIAVALNEFQQKMWAVGKDADGYGYKYATLGKVIQFAYPTMTELGLSVSQMLDHVGDEPALATILMHTSGQYIKGTYPLSQAGMKGVNNAQQLGAAISYARRYGLLSVLGLAAEDDDAHCLNEPPKDIKKAADDLGMTVEQKFPDTMDKDKCFDAIGSARSLGNVKKICTGHKARATEEGWVDELYGLFDVRKKEFES
jgi:hypothetical protein